MFVLPFSLNRFHCIVFLFWACGILAGTQMLFGIFASYKPKFRCGNGSQLYSNCEEYGRCGSGSVRWEEIQFASAAMEFEWFTCTPNYAAQLSQLQFIGVLIGTVVFGTFADGFGRRPAAIACALLYIVTTAASAFSPSSLVLLVFRFVVGISVGGIVTVHFTYAVELLLPQQRLPLRAFINWGFARIIHTCACWIGGNWRVSTGLMALLMVPALLILLLLPESPPWLHSKGKREKTRESEKRIASLAGIPFIPIEHDTKGNRKEGFVYLLRHGMLRRLAVLWFMWVTAAILSYSTDLNSNTLAGNLYVNQICFGLIIGFGRTLLVIYDNYIPGFSRRALHQVSQLVACLCYATLAYFTYIRYEGYGMHVVNLLASLCIEYTWDACQLSTVEGINTEARASAVASCSTLARLGAIGGTWMAATRHVWPPLIFVLATAIGAANLIQSILFLKETKGVNLENVHAEDREVEEKDEEGTAALTRSSHN